LTVLRAKSKSVRMLSHPKRALPAGFIAPCLPTSAPRPPSGKPWLHEIKHDGGTCRELGRYQSFVATVESGQRRIDVVEFL
jgi:hypothetical protein